MTKRFAAALACPVVLCLLTPLSARAGQLDGTVTDSTGAVLPGARVGVFSPVGLLDQQVTGRDGAFRFPSPESSAVRLLVTREGFATRQLTLPAQSPLRIQLEIAPVSDSVSVVGSTIDGTGAEQASGVSVITGEEIRERNEGQAADLLRTLPGTTVFQQGNNGALVSLSMRGGDTDKTLVEIDGMPVNSFNYGGLFDFSQIPADYLDRIELVRGAQSALYGSYANSGVVNFVTKTGDRAPQFDALAEGGSNDENREALSGSGTVAGFGVAASLSKISDNGEVPNSDWNNDSVMLHVNRNFGSQSFSAGGTFDANQVGTPGPYGSDPAGLYTGLDLISRDKNNTSEYMFHYQDDLTPRLRGELFGGFYLNNSFYASPYGASFNKDIRGQAEGRIVASISSHWTMSAGLVWVREEVENTYITDNSSNIFPLRRDEEGIYWENRFQYGKWYVQVGARGEIFNTDAIPADVNAGHPFTPAYTDSRVNPKIAAAYSLTHSTRLHASFGTGIRPPGGSDLAFTDNPHLKPERNTSVDAGISQTLLSGKVMLDATYFYTRYSDLIVSLGGNLADLSAFQTDNLANAKSTGLEFSAQVRPVRWMFLTANYDYLDTEVLALNHTGLAQAYYEVGQELPRRPPQSGSFRLALTHGRFTGDITGYIRGKDLDVEPNYGASEGFYTNPGYADLGVNLNVALSHGVTLYGSLRNALNSHYEEIFGYPSPRLNFVSGVKWSFRGRQ